jgi:hypothetical protein
MRLVLNKIVQQFMHEGGKKLVWCVIVCYVFKEWKHMNDYESMNSLL